MTEESTTESVASESVAEPTSAPEVVVESTPENIEPEIAPQPTPEEATVDTPTAQPVEPLKPEPISEPELQPGSIPEPEPTPTPEPAQVSQSQVSTPPIIPTSLARELLIKAREMIQFRKRKKLEKIMGMFLKQASITNDQVEKLLHVSDATATRYLKQLETEGRIRRQGVPGHASYSRI